MGTLFCFHQQLLNGESQYEQILRQIADHFHSVVTYSTVTGTIQYVSPNSLELLQHRHDEMVGKKLKDFLHEKDLLDHESNGNPVLFNRRGGKFTLRFRRGDDTYIWVELAVYPIEGEDSSKPAGLLCIIHQLIDKEDSLMQSDKLSIIGQLAAGIVHEIRNPLTSLKGFIQLMKSEETFNGEYLRIMESEIDQIDSISKELMILAKPTEPQFTSCTLQSIFKSCMRLLDGQFFQRRIKVVMDLDSEPVTVRCDTQKLRQVLLNLMKNAIEAMTKPGIISMKITKRGNEGVFEITDEGSGIPDEMMDKLGQPFFTTKSNGTGLGLMMCYKIVEEHHGRIEVESKEGVGATFKVFLPLSME